MSSAVQDLLAILDLERLELNLFRGRSPQVGWQRVFGGQVIGQALVAACRTVDVVGRPPHSLHAYFLLPGDPKVPIIYEVDRIRDGKSFTTRRVVAIQHGQAIYTMAVSFHRDEPGMSHQAKMPEVTKPENLPNEAHIKERVLPLMPDPVRRYYERERPIEWRPVELDRYLGKKIEDGRFHVWIRATARLPDEPAIHQCVLAYASDMLLLDSALIPHGRTVFEQTLMAASLDHALWFHRPFRADDWLLYAHDSPNLSGSRGFSRGLIFARDGTLVASVAQEGLLRERNRRLTGGRIHENGHRHHQAVQARGRARCVGRDRRARDDSERGQGLWPPERPHRNLPRRRIRRELFAQDSHRGGGAVRSRGRHRRGHHCISQDRADR